MAKTAKRLTRIEDRARRNEKWKPIERPLAAGIARDLTRHREMADLSFRGAAAFLGWPYATIDKFEKLDRRVSLSRYADMMNLYFGKLLPEVRANHPGAKAMADPLWIGLVGAGVGETFMLVEYLVQCRLLADMGRIERDAPGVQLYEYMIHLGAGATQ